MKRTGFQPRAKPMSRCAISPGMAKLTIKPRTCKNRACRNKFAPSERHPFAIACCTGCEIILAKQHLAKVQAARAKKERQSDKVRKEALKSRADHLKEAEQPFNAWIRLVRDAADPCISCGRFHKGQWHAGHYLSVGSHPELRFHEDNVHKQCQPCNTEKGGNHHFYRIGLIAKIGIERVEWLEGPHPPAKYTIDDAKTIRATYKAKLRLQDNEGVATNGI